MKVLDRSGKVWELEPETFLQEAAGDNSLALKEQRGLDARDDRGGTKREGWEGWGPRSMKLAAKRAHEITVGQGVGSGEVECAHCGFVLNRPHHGVENIQYVDPADVLATAADGPPEAPLDKAFQGGKRAAASA